MKHRSIFRSTSFLFAFLVISLPGAGRDNGKADSALQRYINNGDSSYSWHLVDSIRQQDKKIYRLELVSQTWHDIPWIHEMEIIVPDNLSYGSSLLFVSGGSLNKQTGKPNIHKWDNATIQAVAEIATDCQTVAAIIWQVPKEPMFNGLVEDEIISLTFHNFLKDKDATWPLLLPMAKSAIRAMDAVQDFSKDHDVSIVPQDFLITGYSKRGWTSWMAAATGDKRIKAIAPTVIDILNMPVNVPYQKFMYGTYSVQIQDYVNLGITESISNSSGSELGQIVDPYSYRKDIKIPKLLLFGTNDEYWTVDAVKNYLYGLKGTTLIKYNPNVGHSLGDKVEATRSLEAFYWFTIHDKTYPELNCKVKQKGNRISIKYKSTGQPVEYTLWTAGSDTRDFRKSEFKPRTLNIGEQSFELDIPSEGKMAFFVMASYNSPIPGKTFTLSSRMYFCEPGILYDKPFNPIQFQDK